MWGLGLFFSVQFTYQFGLFGLLAFSAPNALGLILFGTLAQMIAQRNPEPESLARFFDRWSRPIRLILFLYQFLAITLTIFAVLRYFFQPIVSPPEVLYLLLALLIVLAAAFFCGEEFNIQRIKYSHAILFLIMSVAMGGLVVCYFKSQSQAMPSLEFPAHGFEFFGYAVPICVGLLLGPWLDLQQWQRAIQICREEGSVLRSYLIGAAIFFLLLIFHGGLALWTMRIGAGTLIHV